MHGRAPGWRVSTQRQPLSPPTCYPHPLPWFRHDTQAPEMRGEPGCGPYLAVRMLAPEEEGGQVSPHQFKGGSYAAQE